ncbi:MAG: GAF domain-containing protein [Anaerolineae bacterium]|nr:GAF domain-containing protein [Anaerolineae bacterium]
MMEHEEPTLEELLAEVESLRAEVAALEQEKVDIQTIMDMTVEHSDGVTAELEERLRMMEMLQRAQTREGWEILRARRAGLWGYTFAQGSVRRLESMPSQAAPGVHAISMMVQQDQPVGVIGVREDAQHPLTAEERALLASLSEQIASALDRARLFEVTRRNAARDQIISEISAQMRASLDIDAILQTTVREIGEALNIARVEVRLGSDEDEG